MRTTNVFSHHSDALMPVASAWRLFLAINFPYVPSPQKTAPMRTN
jgi:hypothetical protein